MADRPAVGSQSFVAPHPGSKAMPRWNTAELIDAPRFTWRNWAAMVGPGLLMGGAAIGGGEWLTGPLVTARYGGNMLWLATLSIVFQVIYNLEICRYTLYTGEPIFTGKFRTPPGPAFWLLAYIALDFGALFPYLAASAATPVAMLILRELPDPQSTELVSVLGLEMTEKTLLKVLGNAIFLLALVPLIFGGKIYNSLRAVMTFKIVTVFGFLLVLGALYTGVETWIEITTGFFKFGMVPIQGGEHAHSVDNVFLALFEGRGFPIIDFTTIGLLCAMVAISGQGGLSNTPLSNYTRDQGWGMGHHVGAIPSVTAGRRLQLSHVGSVFEVTADSRARWRRWYRHVMRDQLVIWMPACFIGLALPSILSVEFL
ncbi:MAG: Nramp family divalent metal transporter, partial [Pirellulales bacterium]